MQPSTQRCAAVDDGQDQDSRGASPPGAGILVTAAKRTASEAVPSVEATADCSGKRGKSACCIPGCTSDPKDFKAYNLRYHVCEAHLKADRLFVDKELVRFCQQCGKFEPLSLFDGKRRSCRERLAKHRSCSARRRLRLAVSKTATAAAITATTASEGCERSSEPLEGSASGSSPTRSRNHNAVARSASVSQLQLPAADGGWNPQQGMDHAGLGTGDLLPMIHEHYEPPSAQLGAVLPALPPLRTSSAGGGLVPLPPLPSDGMPAAGGSVTMCDAKAAIAEAAKPPTSAGTWTAVHGGGGNGDAKQHVVLQLRQKQSRLAGAMQQARWEQMRIEAELLQLAVFDEEARLRDELLLDDSLLMHQTDGFDFGFDFAGADTVFLPPAPAPTGAGGDYPYPYPYPCAAPMKLDPDDGLLGIWGGGAAAMAAPEAPMGGSCCGGGYLQHAAQQMSSYTAGSGGSGGGGGGGSYDRNSCAQQLQASDAAGAAALLQRERTQLAALEALQAKLHAQLREQHQHLAKYLDGM